ncbi:hypothetical protein [Phenylobacterium sp.]|uniref:hypothetical protein n=1 Tax=Phenylobacterium sp. TaxID=1871053 RepID=UPI002BF645DF|nr:hypothetical protein [Phenylobacterium sp.]HVI33736.1 hypothetical protein [Phenylobacterium sp.]
MTIFVDGPKGASDVTAVNEVRALVTSLKLPNIEARFRQENVGLKNAIYSGVSELCQRFGRTIVLEDDLVLSPATLEYFNRGLDTYASDERVWGLGAYLYDTPSLRGRQAAFALPFAHPWGWATWSRAWDHFDPNEEVAPAILSSRSFRMFFNAAGVRRFSDILELSTEGRVNSWFIRWYYTVFMHGGLYIYPPRTLVNNIGVSGEGGTHGSRLNPYYLLTRPSKMSDYEVTFPTEIRVDYPALDKVAASWEARVQDGIALAGKLKRRLSRKT